MKNFSILLLVIFLVSCSPSSPLTGEQSFIPSPTPTPLQTKVFSATDTPIAIETSIATEMLVSSENFPLSYNLPEWIHIPEATIGMTISDIDGDIFEFAFLNFDTKNSFEISASSNIVMGYFWLPDGTHFGFLSSDMQTAFLINAENGQVEQVSIPEYAVRFIKEVEREKFIEPLIINENYPNDFTFLPLYNQKYSYDLHYIANYDFENNDNRPVIVKDNETGQIVHITNPSDDFCNIEYMWSPVKSELAVLRSKLLDGCGRMGMPPAERIEIYKSDGEKLASFEGNFTDATWSPDGSKILYADETSNSPCILDINLATKRCLREITRKHPNANAINSLRWSKDGKQIYYTYFSVDESGLCIYNLINGDDFCPTNGLQELKDFDIVRYTVSPDERFLIFHFGGSCATCDYWENPTVGVIGKDGSNFYTLGEEPLVGVTMENSYVMFSYPMVTLLWRPTNASIP
jgi:WD40 repeat protein